MGWADLCGWVVGGGGWVTTPRHTHTPTHPRAHTPTAPWVDAPRRSKSPEHSKIAILGFEISRNWWVVAPTQSLNFHPPSLNDYVASLMRICFKTRVVVRRDVFSNWSCTVASRFAHFLSWLDCSFSGSPLLYCHVLSYIGVAQCCAMLCCVVPCCVML